MGKNIVIFSDGTGQKGGVNNNTNVYKLFNMVEDRTKRQITFYDPGLGTDLKKFTGNVFGRGFSKNLLDCYRFIFENYEAGDEVFLFGFSRGAATVRSLSGFIHLFGALPMARRDIIEEAFSIYKISNKVRRKNKAKQFVDKHHTMWIKIKFIGVFDTVSALGFENRWIGAAFNSLLTHRFHSLDLSESVSYARHALAIDERRKTFLPKIWKKLEDDQPKDRLKQVWFSGVHTDVGGGYKEDDLSHFSLEWMIKEATEKGLLIYEKSPVYIDFLAKAENIDGKMHNEQLGIKGRLFRTEERNWNEKKHGTLLIHESALKRTKNSANKKKPAYSPWIFAIKNKEIIHTND